MGHVKSFHSEMEILDLKSRALTTLVDNYTRLFQGREHLLDFIPKRLRQETFSRLVHKGMMELPLMRRVVDNTLTILDLRSVTSLVDADCCTIIQGFMNLRNLYATKISAPSKSLCNMFSSLHWLSSVDISDSISMDNNAARSMAENCPCLRLARLRGSGITDEGLFAFAENSLTLIGLDVSFTKVSKVGMERLFESPTGRTLRELNIRKSGVVSREDILSVLTNFHNMEDYNCSFETPEDATWVFSRLALKLKNITFNVPL